jgi:hypothetical protein
METVIGSLTHDQLALGNGNVRSYPNDKLGRTTRQTSPTNSGAWWTNRILAPGTPHPAIGGFQVDDEARRIH